MGQRKEIVIDVKNKNLRLVGPHLIKRRTFVYYALTLKTVIYVVSAISSPMSDEELVNVEEEDEEWNANLERKEYLD